MYYFFQYQLLMAQSILSLSGNGWSSKLRLVDKRRAHWILQILGSGLALAGSFIKILDKTVHWNTYHGQFGKKLRCLKFSNIDFLMFSCLLLLKSVFSASVQFLLTHNIVTCMYVFFK